MFLFPLLELGEAGRGMFKLRFHVSALIWFWGRQMPAQNCITITLSPKVTFFTDDSFEKIASAMKFVSLRNPNKWINQFVNEFYRRVDCFNSTIEGRYDALLCGNILWHFYLCRGRNIIVLCCFHQLFVCSDSKQTRSYYIDV